MNPQDIEAPKANPKDSEDHKTKHQDSQDSKMKPQDSQATEINPQDTEPRTMKVDETSPQGKPAPDVLKVTWLPNNHVAELTQILQGVSAYEVERRLVRYVESSIEPAGWRAVWRSSSTSSSIVQLHHPSDYFVDVVNVSHEKLLADVKIVNPVQDCPQEDDVKIIDQLKNKEVVVPLMELYPLAEQENSAIDVTTTAEVVEHIRFFYKHIWQAWDLEEEKCCYDDLLISTRLKLYQDIESGHIPAAIGSEMRGLIKKAKMNSGEIGKIERANEGEGYDQEIAQEDVARLIQLHKQMEQLKARFDLLTDPVLRELSSYQSPSEKMSVSSCVSSAARVKVVVNSLSAAALAQHMSKLPNLLESLPQVDKNAECQTFPSLQLALDAAVAGDTLVLLPGSHSLFNLGLITTGGAIVGLGSGVEVCDQSDAGDVMLDVCGSFTINNLTLRPADRRVAIVHHSGTLTSTDLTIQGGLGGVSCLGGTDSYLRGMKVEGCGGTGVDVREAARVNITTAHITHCTTGLLLENGAKVSMVDCSIVDNRKYGLSMVWPQGTDINQYTNTPQPTLMESLLEEYSGNRVEKNQEEDFSVTAASTPANTSALHRSSSSSLGSLDSGFELIYNVSG